MATDRRVGLIGASSFVGERVRRLLEAEGCLVLSFSRQGCNGGISLSSAAHNPVGTIEEWICLAPVWTLPGHLPLLEQHGVKRLVALSSTSRFSKVSSSSGADRELAARLIEGEEKADEWAGVQGCTLVILQPTLIYGFGRDENVAAIAGFIRRFGFFPLFGKGTGLRQPVHVDDVAMACIAALQVPGGTNRAYVLSGGEELPYRAMVERIFAALGRRPRFLRCPLMVFSLAMRLANLFGLCKGVSTGMAVRMNKDQNFDHSEAAHELGFHPRKFYPDSGDVGGAQ